MIRSEQVRSSLVSSYAAQFGGQVFPFLAKFVLAWYVAPEDYGTYGFALTIFMVAAALRDFGVPYQMVRGDQSLWGTALAWEIAAGAGLCGVISAYAWMGGPGIQNSPAKESLLAVLPLFSIALLFDGVAAIARFHIDRALVIKKSVMPAVAKGLSFTAVAICLAYFGYGIWSLIWGQVAASAVYCLLMWRPLAGAVRIDWGFPGLASLLRHSAPLFAMWLTTVLIVYADNVILGLLFDIAVVGFYVKAYEIAATLPEEVFYPSIARVLYPVLASSRGTPPATRSAYVAGSLALLGLEAPVCFMLLFNAGGIVRLVLNRGGQDWTEAIPFMQLLALLPISKPFARFGVELMKVTGNDWRVIAAKSVNLIVLIGLGVALSLWLGPVGMAWANLIALGNSIIFVEVKRQMGAEFMSFAARLAITYLISLVLFGACAAILTADLPRLIVSIGLVPISMLAALVPQRGHIAGLWELRRKNPL